jgi:hypothetical protein
MNAKEDELGQRFAWAGELLAQLRFEESGRSEAHGLSVYYLPKDIPWGDYDEEDFGPNVRVRVSDHYAHSYRANLGGESIDFNVSLRPNDARDEVERAVRQAVEERAEFLASEDYRQDCEARREEREWWEE